MVTNQVRRWAEEVIRITVVEGVAGGTEGEGEVGVAREEVVEGTVIVTVEIGDTQRTLKNQIQVPVYLLQHLLIEILIISNISVYSWKFLWPKM